MPALDPNRRLRIRLDLAAPASKAAGRPEPKYFDIKDGINFQRFRYWRMKDGTFEFRYRLKGQKQTRVHRGTFAGLKSKAEEVSRELWNNEVTMAQFSQNHRAEYLAMVELRARAGVRQPLVSIFSKGIEAIQAESRSGFTRKNVPEVVTEFLTQKEKELGQGNKHVRACLTPILQSLARFYKGPCDNLRAPVLNEFLGSLNVAPKTHKNYRAVVGQFLRYAIGRNYLSRELSAVERDMDLLQSPKIRPLTIRTWTPQQVDLLLNHAADKLKPFIALQVFAGVRHEEINPEDSRKSPVMWSDVDFDKKELRIRKESAKTACKRILPLTDNLIAWLKRYEGQGPICRIKNTSNALRRAKRKAGLPSSKNESRNVLRKTWISARQAIVKNEGQVAREAGNSPQIIKSNYDGVMSEADAKQYFEIYPPHDGQIILGLFK